MSLWKLTNPIFFKSSLKSRPIKVWVDIWITGPSDFVRSRLKIVNVRDMKINQWKGTKTKYTFSGWLGNSSMYFFRNSSNRRNRTGGGKEQQSVCLSSSLSDPSTIEFYTCKALLTGEGLQATRNISDVLIQKTRLQILRNPVGCHDYKNNEESNNLLQLHKNRNIYAVLNKQKDQTRQKNQRVAK